MKKKFYFQADDYGLAPPCREMHKIHQSVQETTHDPEKITWARKGYFFLAITILDDDFKEILETRYDKYWIYIESS